MYSVTKTIILSLSFSDLIAVYVNKNGIIESDELKIIVGPWLISHTLMLYSNLLLLSITGFPRRMDYTPEQLDIDLTHVAPVTALDKAGPIESR